MRTIVKNTGVSAIQAKKEDIPQRTESVYALSPVMESFTLLSDKCVVCNWVALTVDFTQARDTQRGGTSSEELSLSDWLMGMLS